MKPEENYSKFMKACVLPCILPFREERYLSREQGRKIYCAFYTADLYKNGGHAESDNAESFVKNGRESSKKTIEAGIRESNAEFCVRTRLNNSEGIGQTASGEAKVAKGIILISHGFTESADKYFEVIYYFLKAGYHVCIPEHCGHGRSYRLVEGDLSLVYTDSWQRYVEDLSFAAHAAKKYWAQELPLFLFAHSMGGGIGAALAAKEPDLFDCIVLSSPMIRPLTGGVPWPVTKGIVTAMCLLGRERSYVIGQHAYDGTETFEMGFATSPARYAWYKEKTDAEPLYQMYGASYGWLREAIRLNQFLMKEAWKQITAPLLLIQAGNETVVSNRQQAEFVRKLARREYTQKGLSQKRHNQKGPVRVGTHSKTAGDGWRASDSLQSQTEPVRMIRIPGAKHEIFRSDEETLEKYLKYVLRMFKE